MRTIYFKIRLIALLLGIICTVNLYSFSGISSNDRIQQQFSNTDMLGTSLLANTYGLAFSKIYNKHTIQKKHVLSNQSRYFLQKLNTDSEEVPELFFVEKEEKGNALFAKQFLTSGIIISGLGILTILTTSILANLSPPFDEPKKQLAYGELNLYDILYTTGAMVLSAGGSVVLVSATYKGGTVAEYEKWKKTQRIIGYIIGGTGLGLLATGGILTGINNSLSDGGGALLGVGGALSILGLPSIFIGHFGLF